MSICVSSGTLSDAVRESGIINVQGHRAIEAAGLMSGLVSRIERRGAGRWRYFPVHSLSLRSGTLKNGMFSG